MIDLKRFVNGDEETLAEIIDEYQNIIFRYCYTILANFCDAEDATQLAFIKIYQNRNKIKDLNAFRTYLFKTAYRICIDIIRKRKFHLLDPQDSRVKNEKYWTVIDDTYNHELNEKLELALKKLSNKERTLIYGRILEELSYKELSVIHGKSEESLRKSFERAKKKLAKNLTDNIIERGMHKC